MGSEPATNPETVADRIKAARVRARPLVWTAVQSPTGAAVYSGDYTIAPASDGQGYAATIYGVKLLKFGLNHECIAACNAHHAAAVMANLEVVPIQEPPL